MPHDKTKHFLIRHVDGPLFMRNGEWTDDPMLAAPVRCVKTGMVILKHQVKVERPGPSGQPVLMDDMELVEQDGAYEDACMERNLDP